MSNPRLLAVAVWTNWRRLAILLLLVIAVASYFLVPFFLDLDYLNRSVWADPTRYDSYGHSVLLSSLIGGHLFDGFNRVPMLSILAVVGFAVCLLSWRNARYLVPTTIFLLWMMLYFSRPTWGSFVDLLPMSRDIHMNRFIGGVHLGGIFLIAVALAAPLRWAFSRSSIWYAAAALALMFLVLLPVFGERRSYLAQNAQSIDKGGQALTAED